MGVLTVTMGTTATQFTRNRAIDDNDLINRVLPAFRYAYGASLTNQQLMDTFFNEIERFLLATVRRYEKNQAEASIPAVNDLPLT